MLKYFTNMLTWNPQRNSYRRRPGLLIQITLLRDWFKMGENHGWSIKYYKIPKHYCPIWGKWHCDLCSTDTSPTDISLTDISPTVPLTDTDISPTRTFHRHGHFTDSDISPTVCYTYMDISPTDISPTVPLTDTDISPTETFHRQTFKPVTYQIC